MWILRNSSATWWNEVTQQTSSLKQANRRRFAAWKELASLWDTQMDLKIKKMTTYYSHWNVGGTQDFCIFNFTKIPSTFSFYCRDDVITPEVCLMQMRCEVLRFQQENGNAKHKCGKVWKQVSNVQLCLGCPEYHFIFLVRSLKNYILKTSTR